MTLPPGQADVVVVGSGFGGLGAALTLAEQGARVVLVEALKYPGGCASTFTRRGCRFESGATLFSGFAEGQLFRRWIDRHQMAVDVDFIDPAIELRSPGLTLSVPQSRDDFIAQVMALPGAPQDGLQRWFSLQKRVADTLWPLFDRVDRVPPFSAAGLGFHVAQLHRYPEIARWMGRPLIDVLRHCGVDTFEPLRTFLDAVCQITVQAGIREAEAPFAMSAVDYTFRGTGHVHGGIGTLAWEMTRAIERLGGTVKLAHRVSGLRRHGRGWRVCSRRGDIIADTVVLNVLPQAARTLLGLPAGAHRTLDHLSERVETGWGAAMLYLVVPSDTPQRSAAHHVEMVVDPAQPLIEGNHLFASVSGADELDRAPNGARTVTVSTHVPMAKLRTHQSTGTAADYIQRVQDQMRAGLAARAPELWDHRLQELPGSPRTFARFTGRPHGYVGGVPRRAGLHNYANLWPAPVMPGVWLVGDTMFPGQSTLATAIGGARTARAIAHPVRERLVKPEHQSAAR